MSWMRIYTIAIEIPLLPNTTKTDKIRETVLRLIVQALISDYRSKNLFQRLRLPVTYYRRLKEIENLLLYKKVIRREDSKFSFAKYNSAFSLGKALEYEFDLTYADIELLLKSFFLKFSHNTDFIIVFDELDKYESPSDDNLVIKPHEYIKELKNLFTLTNAKFIFTSTENYYQEIDEKSKTNVLELSDYKFSLFTHKLLINHLEPDDFSKYFDHMFIKNQKLPDSTKDLYNHLLYSMMWISDLYPFAAKKLLSEIAYTDNDGSSYVDLVTAESDLKSYGNNISSIEYIVTKVYGQFAKENDEYFNRFLYKALKKVARVLYSGRIIEFSRHNCFALILDDLEFYSDAEKRNYFQKKFSSNDIPKLSQDETGWESQLIHRDNIFKEHINLATTRLIWYFDAIGIIRVTQTSDNMVRVIYVDDNFPLAKTAKRFNDSKKEYQKLARQFSSSRKLYLERIKHAKIQDAPALSKKQIPPLNSNRKWSLLSIEQNSYKDLTASHDLLRTMIAEKIISDISMDFPSAVDKIEGHALQLSFKEKTFRILVSVDNEVVSSALSENPTYKIICINPTTLNDSELIRNNQRLKYFYFETDSLVDYPHMLEDINKYITAKVESKPYTRVRVMSGKRSRTRA